MVLTVQQYLIQCNLLLLEGQLLLLICLQGIWTLFIVQQKILTLDASSTTGAQSYIYTLNGVQQAGTPTSTASFTFLAGTISDGDSIGVIAYSGLGGAGCSNAVSETIQN